MDNKDEIVSHFESIFDIELEVSVRTNIYTNILDVYISECALMVRLSFCHNYILFMSNSLN